MAGDDKTLTPEEVAAKIARALLAVKQPEKKARKRGSTGSAKKPGPGKR